MKLLTLKEAKENPLAAEEYQLKNWLNSLYEYVKKDTSIKVERGTLMGNDICPSCENRMAMSVKNYCDICGQKIVY